MPDTDQTLPVFGAQTLDDTFSAALSERRFSVEIVAAFAMTALVLAALGIYGVISFAVSQRTHEMGIRLALGAERQTILRMIVSEALALTVSGLATGTVCALIVSHVMAGALYGVRPTDHPTFASVAVVLTTAALFASYIPARRAVRVDPLIALRYE